MLTCIKGIVLKWSIFVKLSVMITRKYDNFDALNHLTAFLQHFGPDESTNIFFYKTIQK